MKNLFRLNLILLIFLVGIISSSIFAYFVLVQSFDSQELKSDNSDLGEVVALISSESDLWFNSFDTVFLANGVLNDGTILVGNEYILARKILRFNNDITLTTDLVIEADVNIDLNGYSLNLNGYNLTIRHNYISNLTLQNGVVLDSSSQNTSNFFIEVQNSQIVYSDFSSEVMIVYLYDFYKVKAEIVSCLNKIISGYYISDIPLIFNYKHYPIEIKYQSNSEQIDTEGRIKRASSDTTVEIQVQITDENHPINQDNQENSFDVIIVGYEISNLGNTAINDLTDYLESLKFSGETLWIEQGGYVYFKQINLLNNNSYLGIDYKYSIATNMQELTFEQIDNTLQMLSEDGYVVLRVEVFYLDEFVAQKDYLLYCANLSDYELMRMAMQLVGLIQISTGNSFDLMPTAFTDYIDNLNVRFELGIEVYVTMDENDYFAIENNILFLTSQNPNEEIEMSVQYVFTFQNGYTRQYQKSSRIILFEGGSGMGGDIGLSGSDKIYYEVLNMFLNQHQNIDLLQTFELPNEFDGYAIKYQIEVSESDYYQKNGYTDYYALYATAQNIFGADSLGFISNGSFEINLHYVPPVNQIIKINLYIENVIYKKSIIFTLAGILRYNRPTGNAEIVDKMLFFAMLKNYMPNFQASYNLFNPEQYYLTASVVQNADDFKISKSLLGLDGNINIADYSGLERLTKASEFCFRDINDINLTKLFAKLNKTNIKRLIMSNCGVTNSKLTSIGSFTKLVYLDLSCNQITNLQNLQVIPTLKEIDLSQNSLSNLENLSIMFALENLVLDITKYSKQSLEPLRKLQSLRQITLLGADSKDLTESSWGDENLQNQLYVTQETVFCDANTFSYTMMYLQGIRVFYTEEETIFRVAAPTAEQQNSANILDSIFYFNTASIILLPKQLSNKNNETYTLNYQIISGGTESFDSTYFKVTAPKSSVVVLSVSILSHTSINTIDTTMVKEIEITVN